jgi:hypothetical protein
MKKQMIIIACLSMYSFLTPTATNGQNNGNSSNFNFGADVVSRYVWRGLNLGGSSPHVQPYIEYEFGQTGLAIGAWGSYSLGFGIAGTEADLYLSYSPSDWFNLTISDYFFPKDVAFERNNYFNYKKDETAHTYEAMITLGGTESFPLYTSFAMNFYGADGINEKGENYNAKYIELGYNTNVGNTDLGMFLGIAPDNPKTDQGGEGWYGDSSGIINLGMNLSKNISIVNHEIPVFSAVIFNPEAGNFFLLFGLSF